MKFNKQMSILLTLVMLLSTLISTLPVPVMAQDTDTAPLELIRLNPGNNVSLEGIEAELSMTFNQPVTVAEGKQIQLLYDKEGDGIPDDPVLVQEQAEAGQETPQPHDGILGDKGEYGGVLTVQGNDREQVKIDLSYEQQPLIEENHVYRLNIYQVIKTTDGQQAFQGLGLEQEQEIWIFDTHTHNEITSIEITGEDTVKQDESITLKAKVKNQYQNTLLKETIIWTSSDDKIATVNENGEVTGVSGGLATITAISNGNEEITAQKEIAVEPALEAEEQEKQQSAIIQETAVPLELETLTPVHNGSLGSTSGEISMTFNQPVEIASTDFQIALYEDRDFDGKGDALVPGPGSFDAYYSDVMTVSDEDPCKVILNINSVLEENKHYVVIISPTPLFNIRVKGSGVQDVNSDQIFRRLGEPAAGTGWSINTYPLSGEACTVDITSDRTHLSVGGTANLEATVKDSQGEVLWGDQLTWTSSDETIATVNAQGQVTGTGEGDVVITAASQSNPGATGTFTLHVVEEASYDITIKEKIMHTGLSGDHVLGVKLQDGIVYAVRAQSGGTAKKPTAWFYAYDLMGNKIWEAKPKEALLHTQQTYIPAIADDGTLYIQCQGVDSTITYLYALDGKNGDFLWDKPIIIQETSISQSEPLLAGSQVIVTTQKGLYSFDAHTGEENWHYTVDGEGTGYEDARMKINTNAVIYGNDLYLGIQGNSSSVNKGKIQALDIRDGEKKWQVITDESKEFNIAPPGVSSDGTVYITDDSAIIKAYDGNTGEEKTSDPRNAAVIAGETQTGIGSFLMGPDNILYAAYEDGDGNNTLRAINPDGTIRYTYNKDFRRMKELVIDEKGYAYYSTQTGDLAGGYAIFAISPCGEEAGRINPYGSSISSYFNISVQGNTLAAGRLQFGEFIIAGITFGGIEEKAASIEIPDTKDIGLYVKESLGTIVRNAQGQAISGQQVQWESSDPSVIQVTEDDGKYRFTGKNIGAATLTATVEGTDIHVSRTFQVTEKAPVATSLEFTDARGNPIGDSVSGEYNTTYTLYYMVYDQYGHAMPEEGIYQDGQNGGLNFYGGQMTYTFIEDRSMLYQCVSDMSIEKIIQFKVTRSQSALSGLTPARPVLNPGGTIQLDTLDQYGESFTLANARWESSDEDVAVVDALGNVIAKGQGTATITVTSGETAVSSELQVVPTLGYGWYVEAERLGRNKDAAAVDEKGNVYYYALEDSHHKLIAVDSGGSRKWEIPMESTIYYVTTQGERVYFYSGGKIYCASEQGDILWESESSRSNFDLDAHGTLYLSRGEELFAIDPEGNVKWTLTLEASIGNILVDSQGMVWATVHHEENTLVYQIEDGQQNPRIVRQDTYSDLILNISDMAVDEQGVLYATHDRGICALDEGEILWNYSIEEGAHQYSSPRLVLQGDTLYAMTDPASVHAIDPVSGEERWKQDLSHMASSGTHITCNGDFAVDGQGNIYIPLKEQISEKKYSQSMVVVFDKEGTAVKSISYPSEIYSSFGYIVLKGDSIYVTTDLFSENQLIKLTLENTSAPVPATLRITAPKSNVTQGNSLQLSATVYSQVGMPMDEQVVWTSSQPKVAQVDDKGKVTGINPGPADITAACASNGDVKAVLTVTVQKKGEYFVNEDTLLDRAQSTISYYKKVGISGDWPAFALWAMGEDINASQYDVSGKSYIGQVWDRVSAAKGNLGAITEYERVSLGIMAAGYDPHDFAGCNLMERIYNYVGSIGNNGVMWGLIALNMAKTTIPEDGKMDRDYFITYLLTHKAGGGWTYAGNTPDTDMTAMAIYALAPYYQEREDVKASVDEAVEWLKTVQNENGSFNYGGGNGINTESTAQVIMALTSIGIDPQGEDFTKSAGNPVTAMLSMQLSDGQFEHNKGDGADDFATNQSLQALAALKQYYQEGISTIFSEISYNRDNPVEPWMELITDINTLPEEADEITLDHETLIKELRARYEALSEEDRDKVTNIDRLIMAERKIQILKDKKAPSIITNLKNQKVTSKTLSFTVKVMDEVSGEIKPTVKLNGNSVTPNGYSYTVTLKEGKNTIAISAADDNSNKTEQTYTITYEPQKQEEGKDNDSSNNSSTGGNTNNTTGGNTDSQTEEQDETADNQATEHLRESINKNMEEVEPGGTVSLEMEQGALLDGEILNKLKEKENVTVIFKGEGYTISFNTSDIGDYDEDFEMNLNMSFTSDNKETIKEKIGSENAMILHFDYHGELPVPMTVVVKLPDDLKDKDPLYLYYYNETTGEMEMVEEANLIIQDGYAQFTITHCSDYTITDAAVAGVSTQEDTTVTETPTPTEKAQETGIDMTLIIILIAAVLLGVIAFTLFYIKRKKA